MPWCASTHTQAGTFQVFTQPMLQGNSPSKSVHYDQCIFCPWKFICQWKFDQKIGWFAFRRIGKHCSQRKSSVTPECWIEQIDLRLTVISPAFCCCATTQGWWPRSSCPGRPGAAHRRGSSRRPSPPCLSSGKGLVSFCLETSYKLVILRIICFNFIFFQKSPWATGLRHVKSQLVLHILSSNLLKIRELFWYSKG